MNKKTYQTTQKKKTISFVSNQNEKKMIILQDVWSWKVWQSTKWNIQHNLCDTINNIKIFWQWQNNLPLVTSDFFHDCTIAFFKADIKPVWEDLKNINGGKLNWFYIKENYPDNNLIHLKWEKLLLLLIGNQPGFQNNVNGVTITIRPTVYRFSLWTEKVESIDKIKKYLIDKLEILPNCKLDFKTHQETIQMQVKQQETK